MEISEYYIGALRVLTYALPIGGVGVLSLVACEVRRLKRYSRLEHALKQYSQELPDETRFPDWEVSQFDQLRYDELNQALRNLQNLNFSRRKK